MRWLLCFLAIVLLITSCHKNNKNDDTVSKELNGRYRGTFHRTGMDTVTVDLFFNTDSSFQGSGGRANYPALCRGIFKKEGDALTIDDGCTWTANFDWTLIFDGNYTINFTNNDLIKIWRTNGALTDEYILSRFTR